MKAPAFQFYPQDFLVGTAEMTCEEVGGYIRLLCYQWAKGGLPKDDKKLMQLTGITEPNVLGNVSVKFEVCEDGLLRNKRLVKIKAEQDQYHQKQRENGHHGGNPNFQTGKPNPYYKKDNLNQKDNPKITDPYLVGNVKDNPLHNPPHNPKINPSPSPSPYYNIYIKRIGMLFKRKEKTQWDVKEESSLKILLKRSEFPAELDEIEKYYTSGAEYLRHDVQTLLNNWNGELDRARKVRVNGSSVKKDVRPSLEEYQKGSL